MHPDDRRYVGSMSIPVGLSTASVYPDTLETGFRLAAEVGFDGVEVMVQVEPASQSATRLLELAEQYGQPVLSVHSPCLLITAAVWGTNPLVKLARSVDLAEEVGADTVGVHPPFVWQRSVGERFAESVAELQARTAVRIAVENMFPVRVAGRSLNTYRPHWDPVPDGHRWYTLDLSHTATSGADALVERGRMGERLAHLHLADGTGTAKDEHLVPGRGGQPCAQILADLAAGGFDGAVILEIATRTVGLDQRWADLDESLLFARRYLSTS